MNLIIIIIKKKITNRFKSNAGLISSSLEISHGCISKDISVNK